MRKMKQPCQSGGLKSFFKYLDGPDLTEKEIERLLELFRSAVAAFWVSVPSKEWRCVTSTTSTTLKRIPISSVF